MFLRSVGRACARWHWAVIGAWLVVLCGLLLARAAWGGDYANDYTVPGTESQRGADILEQRFPAQSGNAGQVVFAAPAGGQVASNSGPVNQAMGSVAKLDHVVSAVSPFAASGSPLVSKDGTVAYGTVNFDVAPNTLGEDYLARFDDAVRPARAAGLQVEYGGAAGQIGQRTEDVNSEALGLACALLLLVFMFGSVLAAAIPLLSAVLSVLAGTALLGLLAAAFTFPTTAPTVATLLGLGVAVDYGLFLVARHRENLDAGLAPPAAAGASCATSGSGVRRRRGGVPVGMGIEPRRGGRDRADPRLRADVHVRDHLRAVHRLRGLPPLPRARVVPDHNGHPPQCGDRHR